MKIRPIFKTIDIFSFIQFLSRQTNYIIKFFLLKVLYLVYHAASSEEPDTMDGPSLCDYYQRREETEQTRRALVDAVGDEVDVDSYGVAMECQGFVNGFKLALGLCMGVCCCG